MGANWYCIRTATRQEAKVVEGLHDLAHARRIDIDVYLPCETRWNLLARERVPKDVPMIPGYLFLKVEADHLWRVDKVEGVYQILGWSSRHTAREANKLATFVGELRTAQAAGLFDLTRTPSGLRIELGEQVMVSEQGGAYTGWIGEITKLRRNKRVAVLFRMIGSTPIPPKEVELDPAHLKPAA